jgi:predicted MFS family arabinose efflux permease
LSDPPDSLSTRLGPLAERSFRLLFLARTTSLLGSAIAPIALAFAILDDLDGSATALGLVLASTWIPQVVLMLIGGVFADRLRRDLLLVGTDLVMTATQAAVAALLLTGRAEIWHLAALQAVRGSANAFFWPASAGIVPETVSPPRLQQANALLGLSTAGVTVLGGAVGGALVAGLGPGLAFAIDSATYLGSAAFLLRIRLPKSAVAASRGLIGELREGWTEFWSRTWLWSIVIGAALGNMAMQAGQTVLGPVVAKEHLGGAAAWGAIVAAESVGLVLGGLVVLRFRPQRLLLVGCVGLIAIVPMLAALAVPAHLFVIMAATLCAGIGLEVFNVLWQTTMQQQIPRDRLSRVSAYDALGSFVFIPIGLTIAGPLADVIGVSETIWLAAAVTVAVMAFVLSFGDVRTLRRTDSPTDVILADEVA